MSKDKQFKGRAIVTYGRSLMALTAAHSLYYNDVEVIGCDDVDMTVLSFSRHVADNFVHAPYEENPEQYLDDLEENIKKFKPNDDRPYVLVPMFRDAKLLARHQDRFKGLIDFALPPQDALQAAETKDAFAATAEKYNLPVPITYSFENVEALKKAEKKLTMPLLIKPKDGVGGRGIHKYNDFDELVVGFNKNTKEFGHAPLIQTVAPGEDYCLSVMCNHGEVVAHMAYTNIYRFPYESGAGIMRETIDDHPFLESAQTLMKKLKWHGVAQFDYMWTGDPKDTPIMIEVNARFWAGLFHCVESGVDYPWLYYQLAAFGKIDQSKINVDLGARTKVPGLWALSAIQDIADSDIHFDKLKEGWIKIWDDQPEPLMEKFKIMKEALGETFSISDLSKQLSEMSEKGRSARSELDLDNEPFLGLGAMFVFSSLLKHGKLPPELK